MDPPRRRRARPVADAPVHALLERSEDLTKGWLLALLEEAPLDEAPGILAADLGRDGPRICAAVVRALAADEDLRRLEPGGALELVVSQTGELAGAKGVAATSHAVDTLGSVVWSAIRGALTQPDPEQISELAERLALVIECVRGAALRRAAGEVPALGAAPPQAVPPAAEGPAGGAGATAGPAPGPTPGPPEATRPGPTPGPPDAMWPGPTPGPPEATRPGPGEATPAEPVPTARSAPGEAVRPAPPTLRDATAESSAPGEIPTAADTLWVGAVEAEIVRSERNGTPLSLLLVELEEAGRMTAVESPLQARATFGRFAQAVRSAVRRQDILACETDTRAWIIARDTGRMGARALGARIAGAVRSTEPWRGAPLTVSVGLSVLGEDGHEHGILIEAAEESRFAAAASGLDIDDRRPEDDGSGPLMAG